MRPWLSTLRTRCEVDSVVRLCVSILALHLYLHILMGRRSLYCLGVLEGRRCFLLHVRVWMHHGVSS
jgi:hypothetical protein